MGLLSALFGSKPKAYPVLRPEMLQPVDNPISTQEAERIFREWMLKIGYLDKDEVGDHVGYLADNIRMQEEGLKDDLNDAKATLAENIKDAKAEIKEAKAELKSCNDPATRVQLEADLAEMEAELQALIESPDPDVIAAEQALAAFKADKRDFLVQEINRQVHGGNSA